MLDFNVSKTLTNFKLQQDKSNLKNTHAPLPFFLSQNIMVTALKSLDAKQKTATLFALSNVLANMYFGRCLLGNYRTQPT